MEKRGKKNKQGEEEERKDLEKEGKQGHKRGGPI